MTPERFAKGMLFGYLRERHAKARLGNDQTAAIKWLAAQPGTAAGAGAGRAARRDRRLAGAAGRGRVTDAL